MYLDRLKFSNGPMFLTSLYAGLLEKSAWQDVRHDILNYNKTLSPMMRSILLYLLVVFLFLMTLRMAFYLVDD